MFLDKLFQMVANTSLLLPQLTGGGKSAVWDTLAALLAGVTMTIMPIPSLSTDQANKVMERTFGKCHSISPRR
jgi:superfamily II DNA helicase RecQ